MTSIDTTRLGRTLLFAAAIAALAACGGGSSTPASTSLGPTASSVTSSDGKVTVSVGDNALQAPVSISIVPATPDTETAADPSLVPGTTYDYTAPDMQVPEQVMITIESPLAVSAAAAPARERALALPLGYVPPPTCLVNAPGPLGLLQPVQNIWVDGPNCPQSPAPACLKIQTVPVYLNPNLLPPNLDYPINISGTKSLCAPAEDVIAIPDEQICPAYYREVTGEPAFASVAAQYADAKICQRLPAFPPPVLSHDGKPSTITCTPKHGKFLCFAGRLPRGRLAVLWDRTPPPAASAVLKTPGTASFPLILPEGGPPGVLSFQIQASDPGGLGAVELVEILGPQYGTDSSFGAGIKTIPTQQVWSASAALFQGAPLKQYDSGVFTIPHSLSDPSPRSFFVRVYDRSGNSTRTDLLDAVAAADVITIEHLTIELEAFILKLVWKVRGAAAASIDNGVGSLPVSDNLAVASFGQNGIAPTVGTTYTLTATHPTRGTKTASVTVGGPDITAPTLTLSASPPGLFAPGSTTLTANALDAVGVTKVEFFRGATLIGTDTTSPFTQAVSFTLADVGTVAFTAKAYDAANNSATSAVANVAVGAVDVTPPTVSLVASPASVLAPGITTLRATPADASGIGRVEFYRGATLLTTLNAAPYQTTVAFTAADVGSVSFTAKAFDGQNNSATSLPAVVFVSAGSGVPSITLQPVSVSVVAPATGTFTAAASGTPSPTVQWQQSTDAGVTWANITAATSSSYTTPATVLADSGQRFRAVFTNGSGSVSSNAAVLTVTVGLSAGSFPFGVTVDAAGNVYAANFDHTIVKITPAGVVTTLAGLAGSLGSTDGTGSAARFNSPRSVAVDAAGNLYVADTTNNTIRKITADGFVSTLAGLALSLGSADGAGPLARFSQPLGVAVDATGNVYVADASNNTIRAITPAGVVSTLAGLAPFSGSADGAGPLARFQFPVGIDVDAAGNVYVGDQGNHTIRMITPAGVVSTLAGLAGSAGSVDGTGPLPRFNGPHGVAVDAAGNVYDADLGNQTIRKIRPSGVVSTLAGLAGSFGSSNGTGSVARFNNPRGVAVDAAGNVYVADTDNNSIRKITPAGVVTTFAQ